MADPNRAQAVLFAELLAKQTPAIRKAFMIAVTDINAHVDWDALLSALESGSTGSALAALNINEDAFSEYAHAMTSVFVESGTLTTINIVKSGVGDIGLRYRYTDPRAQSWITRNVASRVVGFASEQINAARSIIEAGFARGDHPFTIATDIAGRATGPLRSRQGGILGLDAPRAERYNKVSVGMRTAEGVQELVIRHHNGSLSLRYKVNQATATRILSAYRSGSAVPDKERAISEVQYKNALLKDRADTIAQTETANAVMGARNEAWTQAAEFQGLSAGSVIKRWEHRRGGTKHHRPEHLAMSGKEVIGIDTPFVFPDGVMMKYAHDENGGAAHIINCGCDTIYRIERTKP